MQNCYASIYGEIQAERVDDFRRALNKKLEAVLCRRLSDLSRAFNYAFDPETYEHLHLTLSRKNEFGRESFLHVYIDEDGMFELSIDGIGHTQQLRDLIGLAERFMGLKVACWEVPPGKSALGAGVRYMALPSSEGAKLRAAVRYAQTIDVAGLFETRDAFFMIHEMDHAEILDLYSIHRHACPRFSLETSNISIAKLIRISVAYLEQYLRGLDGSFTTSGFRDWLAEGRRVPMPFGDIGAITSVCETGVNLGLIRRIEGGYAVPAEQRWEKA